MRLPLSLARAAGPVLSAARASTTRQIQTAALAGWRRQSWKPIPRQLNTVESWRRSSGKPSAPASTSKFGRQFSSGRPFPPAPRHTPILARNHTTSHFPPPRNLSPRQPSRPRSGPAVLATVQFLSTALGKGDEVHRHTRLNFSPQATKPDSRARPVRTSASHRSFYATVHGPKPVRPLEPISETKLNRAINEMGMYNTHLRAARVVMLECLAGRQAEMTGSRKRSSAYILQAERLKMEMALEKAVNETRIIDDLFQDIVKSKWVNQNPALRERRTEEESVPAESEWEDIEEESVQERRSVSGVV